MLQFNREFDFEYGVMQRLTPLIRRVVAPNPGAFTFHGTSTFIIGNREVAVLDPGPAIAEHIDAIVAGLGDERVTHIIASHTHVDHSSGCRSLKEKTGAPIYGFATHMTPPSGTPEHGIDREFNPDHQLKDGDVISGLDWHLRALHTPGHCSNHLCFSLPEENTLLSGDQVMAWSSTAILPPDGNLGEYLISLEALRKRPETIYLPTHGAAVKNPREHIADLIAHRHQRIEQVFACVADQLSDLVSIRARIYTDLAENLHGAAESSIRATLHFLIEQGRISGDCDSPDGTLSLTTVIS